MSALDASYDDGDTDSRTLAVGSKPDVRQEGQVEPILHHSSESSLSPQSFTMGNTASQHASFATVPSEKNDASVAANSGFGNNRLATGFHATFGTPLESNVTGPEDSLTNSRDTGVSVNNAIEISEDEQEEDDSDDGGMLINVDNPRDRELPQDMDVDNDPHPRNPNTRGPILSTKENTQALSHSRQGAHEELQDDASQSPSAVLLNTNHASGPLLADLSQDELKLQLKYAYFDADPDVIDLGQPAACLSCLQIGHVEQNCPEVMCAHCSSKHPPHLCPHLHRCSNCRSRGHTVGSCHSHKNTTIPCDFCGLLSHVEQACPQRFFACKRNPTNKPMEIWISCCICSSNEHLVGDCPRSVLAAQSRWSLRSFDPGSVINLSSTPEAKRREKEAANRGLRPEGLEIRGHASRHNVGGPRAAPQADEPGKEQFLNGGRLQARAPRPTRRTRMTFGSIQTKVRIPSPPYDLPKEDVLLEFVEAVNIARKEQGKSEITLYGLG